MSVGARPRDTTTPGVGVATRPGALAAVLLAGPATGACAQPSPQDARDWSAVATDDLHFIRAVLRENHPGPMDPENPWFRDWYERGFEEAGSPRARLRRRRARDRRRRPCGPRDERRRGVHRQPRRDGSRAARV